MEKFKNLYLNRTKIAEAIEKYAEIIDTEIKFECVNIDLIRHRWNVCVGSEEFYIDMHYRKNGTTTIDLSGGKQSNLRTNLSEYIRDRCCIKVEETNESWFTVKNIANKDFDPLIQLLKESEYYEKDEMLENSESKCRWKIYGRFGEQLTIQYYKSNGTVLLQGRPLLLFSDARSYLCTLLDEESVTNVLNSLKYCLSGFSIVNRK